MEYVRLGRSGLKVSRLTLGCMSFGDPGAGMHGWALTEDRARPFYRQALDGGINFFDTADVYSRGTSEEITGRMLREMARREDVVIATKVMGAMSADPNDRGLSRKHILQSIDASLKRLGTDYVDLYQIHRFDAGTPIEETLEALEDVVRAGKALYIGASSMYAWQFARMLAVQERSGWTRFASMQPQYSPAYREEEREMLPLCLEEGVGVIPWSPMAGGFLAHGRARPDEAETARSKLGSPHGHPFDNPDSRAVFDAVSAVAKARGVSNAVVVYAWLKTRPWITSPIVGATRPAHLADAIAGLALDLSDEELAAIESPYRPREVFGLAPRR
ncbi:MAG: aldo/keto reductase [Sphingomonas sp.]